MIELAEGLWVMDGDTISFIGFPYEVRMTVVRLSDGTLFVHSPVQHTEGRQRRLEDLGAIAHLVTPNKLHHLFLGNWAEAVPDARLYAPPKLAAKRPDLPWHAELGDEPEPAWADTLEQVVVRGSFFMEEAVFFHRSSRTLILGDLIENHEPERFPPVKRWIARRNKMFGDTPRNYRWSFTDRKALRASLERVLEWKPERIVVMHGPLIEDDAAAYLERAFAWAF